MADTQVETEANEQGDVVTTLVIPVTKAKSTVEVVLADVPTDVYMEALALGLKELMNRGMTKLTKPSFNGDEAKLAEACLKVADDNLEKIKTSKIKFAGKKAAKSGRSQAVTTEAMRLAKALVKDGIKASGMKISLVKPSVITAAAKEYLAQDPSLYDKAEANLEERAKIPVPKGIDIRKLIHEDATLKAKAAEEKAKKPLSAKQSGKVKPRAKPSHQPTAH